MSTALPPDVERFIEQHIDSVEKLEVLLLLRSHAGRAWTATQVARELRIEEGSAGGRLEDLAAGGLLQPQGTEPPAYRYGPASAEDDRVTDALARLYSTHRVRVITLIFSHPSDRIRAFSDAFRLRRKPDGD